MNKTRRIMGIVLGWTVFLIAIVVFNFVSDSLGELSGNADATLGFLSLIVPMTLGLVTHKIISGQKIRSFKLER